MVRTISRVTSPGHQESMDASSNPNRDRQSASVTQSPSIQHIQSMAAAMTELTRQNQELIREIGLKRQHHERHAKEQIQSQEDKRENAESENQSRGIASRRVPHLEKEMDQMRRVMHEIRKNMKRANLVEDLVHRTNSPLTHMMERVTRVIILQLSRLQCTFRGFQTKSCVGPSLQPLKDQHEYGPAKHLPTWWVLSKN